MTETVTEFKEISDDSDFAAFENDFMTKSDGIFANNIKVEREPNLTKVERKSPDVKVERRPKSDESPEDLGKFAEEALIAHNEYRRKHGVKPLKISQKVRFLYNYVLK